VAPAPRLRIFGARFCPFLGIRPKCELRTVPGAPTLQAPLPFRLLMATFFCALFLMAAGGLWSAVRGADSEGKAGQEQTEKNAPASTSRYVAPDLDQEMQPTHVPAELAKGKRPRVLIPNSFPFDSLTKGPTGAPVTIIELSDFECAFYARSIQAFQEFLLFKRNIELARRFKG
jgi:hypothetical protein